MPSPRFRPPRRPKREPAPELSRDYRDRSRQLTFEDTGAMELPPPLDPAIARAIATATGVGFCVELWCDRRPKVAGRWCEEHAPREELSAAIARDLRSSRRRRRIR